MLEVILALFSLSLEFESISYYFTFPKIDFNSTNDVRLTALTPLLRREIRVRFVLFRP